jgi:hypothetical protein
MDRISSLKFHKSGSKITALAKVVVLGDSREASSVLRIRGGHAGAYQPSGLRKRALNDPIQKDFSLRTDWDPNEQLLHLE